MALKCLHSGRAGDVIASLGGCLSLAHENNTTIHYYLNAEAFDDKVEDEFHKRLPKQVAEGMIELLAMQPLFSKVELYAGQQDIDINLDFFRKLSGPIQYGSLDRKILQSFECYFDLSQPWLLAPQDQNTKGRICVAKTKRYNNPNHNFSFLEEHKPLFLGLEEEYEIFNKECPCEYYHTPTLLEAAAAINSCRFFISNPCSLWWLAESQKKPRILSNWKSNVVPCSGICFDPTSQHALEWAVKYCMKHT